MNTTCYPDTIDWGERLTQQDIDSMDPDMKARAEMLAWMMLQRLTGGRLALCPVTIRPCTARCFGEWGPYLLEGRWYNGCGHNVNACGCGSTLSQITLPQGEIGGPVVVKVDGIVLSPTAYRIDNGNLLVRQDGGTWPLTQDMGLPLGQPGTMSITYYPGVGPDDALSYAAGLLAIEWYKNFTNKQCALPSMTTNVVRNGVTITLPAYMETSGIREVDEIVKNYNPHRLVQRSRIVSPDTMSRSRQRTY